MYIPHKDERYLLLSGAPAGPKGAEVGGHAGEGGAPEQETEGG